MLISSCQRFRRMNFSIENPKGISSSESDHTGIRTVNIKGKGGPGDPYTRTHTERITLGALARFLFPTSSLRNDTRREHGSHAESTPMLTASMPAVRMTAMPGRGARSRRI